MASPNESLNVDTPQLEEPSSSLTMSQSTHPVKQEPAKMSRIRSHKGNIPSLPQTKLCPMCPAKFTRTTHLNRHLRSHTNERLHHCETCQSQFTRSDLLTRHKKSCGDSAHLPRSRRKSCQSCAESKIKCDLKQPCTKCVSRGRECVFINDPSRLASRPPSSSGASPRESPTPASEAGEVSASKPASKSATHTPELASSTVASSSSGATTPSYSTATSSPPPSDVLDLSDQLTNAYNSHHLEFWGFGGHVGDLSGAMPQEFDLMAAATSFISPLGFDHGLGKPMDVDGLEPFPFFPESMTPSPSSDGISSGSLDDLLSPFKNHSNSPSIPGIADFPASVAFEALPTPRKGEAEHYLYLFFTEFLPQMPIIHSATWASDGKPPVLIRAMQACGALFVKTRAALTFVSETLKFARESLIPEFARNLSASPDQIHLILAVVLLQTIGLFHQRADERSSSNIYHGMLVMMIRQSGAIRRNAAWVPPDANNLTSIDNAWHEWAEHEMFKRALLLSYLHDCCQSIYFSLPPSFLPGEVDLSLPCDDALWKARDSREWLQALQSPSQCGSTSDRLAGISLRQGLSNLGEMSLSPNSMPLNPFSLFVLIHSILCDMYSVGAAQRSRRTSSHSEPDSSARDRLRGLAGAEETDKTKDNLFSVQYSLHGWLQSWMKTTSERHTPFDKSSDEEPRFISNGLPFYWLAQVSLMAHQQGLPPFSNGPQPANDKVEATFRLVKRWLCHIREFLKKGGNQQKASSNLWEDLMKIRLQTWQPDGSGGGTDGDANDGLLAFFGDQ
ncbi:hypothetical protein JAAARDRAFT_199949 [Jaapia argillacea MUCL 33604]|uniref:Zn(2)-C6 fungal-type domain-containing protein n=1 Tax=Jaapia argillacea MUCL 33604 TaxID=933084 RepID=A0A067P716_9AGAM|nr:hypothetical protein JAAARDRAFT_199949 [Jaapia argillacea MUCL 33604]